MFCIIAWVSVYVLQGSFSLFLKQVIQHHDFFLDKCLRECLLLLPELLKVSSGCLTWSFRVLNWLLMTKPLGNPLNTYIITKWEIPVVEPRRDSEFGISM